MKTYILNSTETTSNSEQKHEIVFQGLSPVPLASYLSALGIFRLIAEQVDPKARGFWNDEDNFVLVSSLDRYALVRFFLHDYKPSPIIAPWNGRSGFYEKVPTKRPFNAFEKTEALRFEPIKKTLAACWKAIDAVGLTEKPEPKVEKPLLIQACRNTFSDDALEWIDAVFILTDDGAKAPPLLGSGGNDGSLGYTKYFADRLRTIFDPETGNPQAGKQSLLESLFFKTPTDQQAMKGTMGQFDPGAGRDSDWGFVLGMEGALLFASAAVRRVGSSKQHIPAFPFSVNRGDTGYGSSASTDRGKTRGEIWMPIWNIATGLDELKSLMSEGRASLPKRQAKDGLDFATAIANFGVDRGIASFERFSFQARDGLNHYAIPLGRFNVKRRPQIDLLLTLDNWIQRALNAARSEHAPGSIKRAGRRLENAIYALTKSKTSPSLLQSVLLALIHIQIAFGLSIHWAEKEKFLRPLKMLDPKWLLESDDGSVEFSIAKALASIQDPNPLRIYLEPIKAIKAKGSKYGYYISWDAHSLAVVPGNLSPFFAMNWILSRRLLDIKKDCREEITAYVDGAKYGVDLWMIDRFIVGDLDYKKLWDLTRALSMVEMPGPTWPLEDDSIESLNESPISDSTTSFGGYGLLKLCFLGYDIGDKTIKLNPRILAIAQKGNSRCFEEAYRRLNASRIRPALTKISLSEDLIRKMSASLLIPIHKNAKNKLVNLVTRPK